MSFHDAPEMAEAQHSTPRRATGDGSQTAPAAPGGPLGGEAAAMLQLQRLAGNASVSRMVADEEPARSPVLDVVGSGSGRPLDDGLRAEMEGRLGHDFSDVRLHTDARATASAEAVEANAYTVGSDVVVRSDRFDPASSDGKRTVAHELAHVVQQRQGPVAGTPAPGGVSISDPGDEFERAASSVADAAVALSPTGAAPAASGSPGAAQREVTEEGPAIDEPAVQRQAAGEEEEEEDAAMQAVQREAADEEEEEIPAAAP